jgi:dTDP-4-dehydrorhamnose reductase
LANTLAEIISRLVELEAQGLYHVFSKDAMNKYDFGVQLARRFWV